MPPFEIKGDSGFKILSKLEDGVLHDIKRGGHGMAFKDKKRAAHCAGTGLYREVDKNSKVWRNVILDRFGG